MRLVILVLIGLPLMLATKEPKSGHILLDANNNSSQTIHSSSSIQVTTIFHEIAELLATPFTIDADSFLASVLPGTLLFMKAPLIILYQIGTEIVSIVALSLFISFLGRNIGFSPFSLLDETPFGNRFGLGILSDFLDAQSRFSDDQDSLEVNEGVAVLGNRTRDSDYDLNYAGFSESVPKVNVSTVHEGFPIPYSPLPAVNAQKDSFVGSLSRKYPKKYPKTYIPPVQNNEIKVYVDPTTQNLSGRRDSPMTYRLNDLSTMGKSNAHQNYQFINQRSKISPKKEGYFSKILQKISLKNITKQLAKSAEKIRNRIM